MLIHFILLLIPVTAISLSNLQSKCSCQSSSPCSIFCSNGTSDSNDKMISKKIHNGKLKLNKKIGSDELPIVKVKGNTRSRILKRSAGEISLEDDLDLLAPSEQNVTTNQKIRDPYISAKHITDKNQSKLTKIIKSRSESGMDIKCNSQELKELMLENISDNSSVSKRAINDRAEAKFGGSIDVICSKGHFSYVYSSNLYCEAMKGNVTCIAFRQSL
ncbi:ground-like domain protein [Onchocerca flexuosa]|uniref:Ground-like domain protein n=1 Tax=Onchocerca flexuosa TaxID=387005 RepID=A0A238C3Y7_9BILA|nr:ground-like domain protein [Onchocerca flexuosa]